MAGKVYAYIRVSNQDQTFDNQYQELDTYIRGNISKSYSVYKDVYGGNDSDLPKYEELKYLVEAGDTIVVKDLDKLGTSYEEMRREMNYFRKLGVKVKILDFPTLNVNDNTLSASLNNLMIELLSYVIQKEKQKIQSKAIKALQTSKNRGARLGRPEGTIPKSFQKYYKQWESGEINAVEFSKILGISRSTLYRYIDKFKKTNHKV